MGKEILFLKTKEGLVELLNFIESSFNVKYIKAGLLDELPETTNSLTDKSGLGFVDHKDWNFNERYLILNQNDKLKTRKVPQRNGGVKYAIDQLKNSNSLIISLGGYNASVNAIIASKINTQENTPFTNEILKKLNRFIKSNSKKIDGFYIGVDALNMANNGTRLTEDARQVKDYDIQP